MSQSKYRPVLRGFTEPDHDRGVSLEFDPAGQPDADPTKEPCSRYTGAPPKWYLEDDPDVEFALHGHVVKGMRVGGDGAGPLLGDEVDDSSSVVADANATAAAVDKIPAKTTTAKKPEGN